MTKIGCSEIFGLNFSLVGPGGPRTETKFTKWSVSQNRWEPLI